MRKPNILLIMADQLREDALGCTGGWVQTPHVDAIAGEGVIFRNCVTTSPVCMPARVSLATGRYPSELGIWDNADYTMPHDTPTWMASIRDAGYRTSVFGKTHLYAHLEADEICDMRDRESLVQSYGLDVVDEIPGPKAAGRMMSHMTAMWKNHGVLDAYRRDLRDRLATRPYVARPSPLSLVDYADSYVGHRAAEYLAGYNEDRPWFCWVSFGGPHEPWDAPEPYASRYDLETMPRPLAFANTGPADRCEGVLDELIRSPKTSPGLSPREIAELRANYAGNVTLIDDQIGAILEVIRRRGELDNTVVAIVSDHGEMNGDYGLLYKRNFLRSAVSVPLIVRLPPGVKTARGFQSAALVEWIDVGPTLVDIAGGHLAHPQHGMSFLPVAAGRDERHRETALSQVRRESMLLTERWKLVVNESDCPYLLFDLTNDPQESTNLAGRSEYAVVEQELHSLLGSRLHGY